MRRAALVSGLLTAVLLVVLAPPASAAVSFAPHADLAAHTNPHSVAVGDLNGDGKPDLAVANYNSDDVSVLLNTAAVGAAAPAFATKVDFAAGTNPVSVAIGDLNGDGKPDLATANQSSNDVSVLLNTTVAGAAAPSCATHADFAAGTTPASVAVGDLNGDGKPDLAVANQGSDVSVLLNTTAAGAAAPTFATHADFAAGSLPQSVAIGDLNGDGKPDLATANYDSNDVSVLLNTTAGVATPTFATHADFAAHTGPASVAVGDLNGDGKPDLATANYDSNDVSVLLNTTAAGRSREVYGTTD
jgi:hypothetical protein